jgi:hypothetical protein
VVGRSEEVEYRTALRGSGRGPHAE